MSHCLYCNREKDEIELSDEHVIPQAIGGALQPTNPFKTRSVCRRCNNLCGLYVDTAFIKSWFTQASRAQDALRYLNIEKSNVVPLTYMGEIEDFECDGKICEFWLGPTGDSIFHFHQPYPEDPDLPIVAGVHPAQRLDRQIEIDRGFAFLFVVASNPAWHPVIFNSFMEQFKLSVLYLGNGPCPGGPFSEIPPELKDLRAGLNEAIQKNWLHVRMGITLSHETRFLAKLALGIGHLLLAPEFSSSEDAKELRSLMWAKTSDQREASKVRGAGFFNDKDTSIDQVISWERGHLIVLIPNGHGVALHARFYDRQAATIYISTQLSHWRERIPTDGIIFAIAPSLRKFVGPKSIPDFVAHRIGVAVDADLKALEEEVDTRPNLPPTHLPQIADGDCDSSDPK